MSANSIHRAADWVQASLHQLDSPPERGMRTVHLDEIGFAPADWQSIDSLSRIFAAAVRALEGSPVWRKLLLSVLLEETDGILAPPDTGIGRYLGMLSETPPALYLTDLRLWLAKREHEHYKLPLDVAIEGLEPDTYSVYLSQERTLESLRNGETFYNSITFEHFPALT